MSIKQKDIFDNDFEITYEEDDFSEILRKDVNGCGEPLADPEEPDKYDGSSSNRPGRRSTLSEKEELRPSPGA